MTTVTRTIFGWFQDPYHQHELRYFSEGSPTKLVRDAGLESFDLPPDTPMPEAPVPAPHTDQFSVSTDMRRADDAEREAPFDRRAACQQATSAIIRFGSSD